jgi:hypothetical protein
MVITFSVSIVNRDKYDRSRILQLFVDSLSEQGLDVPAVLALLKSQKIEEP